MKYETQLILAGMPVRCLLEGTMSDIHIMLTEWLSELIIKTNKIGDFPVNNPQNEQEQNLIHSLNRFIIELSVYDNTISDYVTNLMVENKDITFKFVVKQIRSKFL